MKGKGFPGEHVEKSSNVSLQNLRKIPKKNVQMRKSKKILEENVFKPERKS